MVSSSTLLSTVSLPNGLSNHLIFVICDLKFLSLQYSNTHRVMNNLGRNSSECKLKDIRIQPVGEEFGLRIGELKVSGVGCQVSGKKNTRAETRTLKPETLRYGVWDLGLRNPKSEIGR